MNEPSGAAALHLKTVRVYFEDTDAGGIVYYANYLRFIERARTELLRDLGIESSCLMDRHGITLAVKRCVIDYQKPAVLDDELVIESEVVRVGGASLDLCQLVRRDADILVSVEIRLGCLDLTTGKPKAIPAGVRLKLDQYLQTAHND